MSDISEAIRRLTATVAASDAFEQGSRIRPTTYPGRITSQDFIEDIRAVLAERAWQPIETAPRDETDILGWAPKRRAVCIAFFSCDNWWSEESTIDLTHWMPLPEAPR